jgi:hypothetical protein
MPSTVTVIRAGAFRFDEADTTARSAFSSINLHEGLSHINERAFLACRKLKELTFPNSIQYLGHRICKDCTGLTKCTFGQDLIQFRDDDSTSVNDGSDFF